MIICLPGDRWGGASGLLIGCEKKGEFIELDILNKDTIQPEKIRLILNKDEAQTLADYLNLEVDKF